MNFGGGGGSGSRWQARGSSAAAAAAVTTIPPPHAACSSAAHAHRLRQRIKIVHTHGIMGLCELSRVAGASGTCAHRKHGCPPASSAKLAPAALLLLLLLLLQPSGSPRKGLCKCGCQRPCSGPTGRRRVVRPCRTPG
jgi:hypothetical protein